MTIQVSETVRIEHSPQVVELPCTEANLDNRVTSKHYQKGRRDANGRLILPMKMASEYEDGAARTDDALTAKTMEKAAKKLRQIVALDATRGLPAIAEGENFAVVDKRAIHAPWVWKVYKIDEESGRYVKIDEFANEADATKFAKGLGK